MNFSAFLAGISNLSQSCLSCLPQRGPRNTTRSLHRLTWRLSSPNTLDCSSIWPSLDIRASGHSEGAWRRLDTVIMGPSLDTAPGQLDSRHREWTMDMRATGHCKDKDMGDTDYLWYNLWTVTQDHAHCTNVALVLSVDLTGHLRVDFNLAAVGHAVQ